VEYRLAPQHPFPTPLEDCYAAFELMHRESSALGIDPRRIMIGGASAGGGLAAALTLLVHDRERPAPILQLLVYPMLDDRTVTPSAARHFHRLWDQPSNALGWRSYLGRPPGGLDVSDHAAPARRSDLRGLPPTWIGVGTLDLFHEEDVAYAERLRAAGVATTLEVVPGAFHGFDVVLPKARVSEAFLVSQLSAMRAALAPG
jgi:acetyl esterase/lipase